MERSYYNPSRHHHQQGSYDHHHSAQFNLPPPPPPSLPPPPPPPLRGEEPLTVARYLPSSSPQHVDSAAFLAYRHRLNVAAAAASSSYDTLPPPDWDRRQLPARRGFSGFRPDSDAVVDRARRAAALRERRDELFADDTGELAQRRRSAAISARLFLDQGRVPSLLGDNHHRAIAYERDVNDGTDEDNTRPMVRIFPRLSNPPRKRSRGIGGDADDDTDDHLLSRERERAVRQRIYVESGLAYQTSQLRQMLERPGGSDDQWHRRSRQNFGSDDDEDCRVVVSSPLRNPAFRREPYAAAPPSPIRGRSSQIRDSARNSITRERSPEDPLPRRWSDSWNQESRSSTLQRFSENSARPNLLPKLVENNNINNNINNTASSRKNIALKEPYIPSPAAKSPAAKKKKERNGKKDNNIRGASASGISRHREQPKNPVSNSAKKVKKAFGSPSAKTPVVEPNKQKERGPRITKQGQATAIIGKSSKSVAPSVSSISTTPEKSQAIKLVMESKEDNCSSSKAAAMTAEETLLKLEGVDNLVVPASSAFQNSSKRKECVIPEHESSQKTIEISLTKKVSTEDKPDALRVNQDFHISVDRKGSILQGQQSLSALEPSPGSAYQTSTFTTPDDINIGALKSPKTPLTESTHASIQEAFPSSHLEKPIASVSNSLSTSVGTLISPQAESLSVNLANTESSTQLSRNPTIINNYLESGNLSDSIVASIERPLKRKHEEEKEHLGPEEARGGSFRSASEPTLGREEYEVRLFGKTLKALVPEIILPPPLPLPPTQESSKPVADSTLPNAEAKQEKKRADATPPNVQCIRQGTGSQDSSPLLPSTSKVVPTMTSLQQNTVVVVPPPATVMKPQLRSSGFAATTSYTRSGAHTWRRGGGNSVTSGSTVALSKLNKVSPASKPPGSLQGGGGVAAYVRKGNSLVRASPTNRPNAPLNTGNSPVLVKDSTVSSSSSPSLAPEALKRSSWVSRNASATASMLQITETSKKSPLNISNDLKKNATTVPDAAVVAHETAFNESISFKSELSGVGSATHDGGDSAEMAVVGMHGVSGLVTEPRVLAVGQGDKMAEASRTCYVKSKANQLIAAVSSPQECTRNSKETTALDQYVRSKTNQLVRNNVHTGSVSQRVSELTIQTQPNVTKVRSQAFLQTKLGRVLKQRGPLVSSWVWTLNGQKNGSALATDSNGKGVYPALFPWKRSGLGSLRFPWKRPGFGSSRSSKFKSLQMAQKGSLLFLMSKKLQDLRKMQPVYTRSVHGFSLHRSGVVSVGGASLKWTKSLERRSLKANAEATKAVAAVEKRKREDKEAVAEAVTAAAKARADRRAARKAARGIKLCQGERILLVGLSRYKMDRSKRTLQKLPDDYGGPGGDGPSATIGNFDSAKLSTPRRLSIGSTKYVRIGNGNKLVRDPKAVSRALATEKVRWSLHTARVRRAKRQQYCQFFTRFGKCNKSEGKCHYIHDPEKIAVCTKFLKGSCSDTNCLLTHKVIPERMPDCSYFLQGLCTNEHCPYRHVNVNPNAPVCEGFLKGYCADGDECNKKHTYACPSYAATGECSNRSECKLHHPNKKDKAVKTEQSTRKSRIKQRRQRYFVSTASIPVKGLQKSSLAKMEVSNETHSLAIDALDYISLPTVDSDEEMEDDYFPGRMELPDFNDKDQLDFLIKPMRLIQCATNDPLVIASAS